jgi:small basic protein
MGWLALFAGIIGFVSVYYSNVSIPFGYAPYISLAALAGIDSLIGGVRAAQNRQFSSVVFVSGFVANALLAAFLVYFGEALGQQLALAAVVALGWRIFTNLSIIRRHWLEEHWMHRAPGSSGGAARDSDRVLGGHAHEPVV